MQTERKPCWAIKILHDVKKVGKEQMKLVLIYILFKSVYPEYPRTREDEPPLPPFAPSPGATASWSHSSSPAGVAADAGEPT